RKGGRGPSREGPEDPVYGHVRRGPGATVEDLGELEADGSPLEVQDRRDVQVLGAVHAGEEAKGEDGRDSNGDDGREEDVVRVCSKPVSKRRWAWHLESADGLLAVGKADGRAIGSHGVTWELRRIPAVVGPAATMRATPSGRSA